MRLSFAALMLSVLLSLASVSAHAQVSVSINIAPPELPYYEQPMLPGYGYIWTPGYWAYDDGDYYWVPGTWVMPPQVGYLWTPGYWYWDDRFYVFRTGYWGLHVGYYGGVNYGYGYGGRGYDGGRWNSGRFSYNRAVNNMDSRSIGDSYNKSVPHSNSNRTSYNGGRDGLKAQPNAMDLTRERETHLNPTLDQQRHQQTAQSKPEQRQSQNHGRPAIAATPRPAALDDKGVVSARESAVTRRATENATPSTPSVARPERTPNRSATTNDAGTRNRPEQTQPAVPQPSLNTPAQAAPSNERTQRATRSPRNEGREQQRQQRPQQQPQVQSQSQQQQPEQRTQSNPQPQQNRAEPAREHEQQERAPRQEHERPNERH